MKKATCECGGPLSINDKFCGSCGKPNPMLAVENEGETVNCISCNEHIDNNSLTVQFVELSKVGSELNVLSHMWKTTW